MRKVKGRHESGEREPVKVARASGPVPAGQEESAPHSRVPEPVPAAWLDRLLAAVLDLPLASGDRAVVTAMVDAVSAILPDYAVGACVVHEHGQVLVTRLPEGLAGSTAGVDPTRVFPGLAHEHVAPLAGTTTGSTFHVASNDDAFERTGSPALHLVERAAMALGRALEVARQLGLAGRAALAVGLANGANPLPIIVPCHRVIGADGSLTGFGGGLGLKRALLSLEGAACVADLFAAEDLSRAASGGS